MVVKTNRPDLSGQEPAFVHQHIPVYGDMEKIQQLFAEKTLAVIPARHALGITGPEYIPSTVPLALRPKESDHRNIIEFRCDCGETIEGVVYTDDGIVIVLSDGKSFLISFVTIEAQCAKGNKEQIFTSRL
ncbi:MAG TPA: hypothetical protein PLF15_03835 [bacterium]|nr:hypothetical protein [bacterium]